MSIDKWLSKSNSKEKQEKIDNIYNALPEEEVQDLKKRSIRELTKKDKKKQVEKVDTKGILSDIIEFKGWLNQRIYLKGDLDKIEIWINNLSNKLSLEHKNNKNQTSKNNRSRLIKQYRKIHPKFLDEKTRVAINKKLNGIKRTNSDNYYLRKLNAVIKEKLHDASYYEILKEIVEL
jgi:hypothetical protein